ncbi:MAG: hypothetical protein K6U74_07740 [Firmicutes bacterium]|nr:hypothetical protein [Bacillota bacterium]
MNRIFLDVGGRLGQGVIDYHQGIGGIEIAGKLYRSTTGLLMQCRHLVRRNITPDAERVEIVVHEDPDFDCFAAAYLVQKLALDGCLPEYCKHLVDYVEDVDSGRLVLTAGTIESPLAVACTLPYPVWASWKNSNPGDSKDLYRQIEAAGGTDAVDREIIKNPELSRAVMRRGLFLIEYCLAQIADTGESSRGFYDYDLFPAGNPFAIEIGLLADDYQRYLDDLSGEYEEHGHRQKICEKVPIRLPAKPLQSVASQGTAVTSGRSLSKVDGLIWNRPPACFLHKHWARQDREAPSGRGYVFTFIPYELDNTVLPNGQTIKPSRVVMAVLPGRGVSLRGLGRALERAELQKEEQCLPDHGHRHLWRDRSVKRFPDRWVTNNDPWYDGRGYDYTIVDAPRCGSLLTVAEIKDIALRFTRPLVTESFLRYIFPFTFNGEKYEEVCRGLLAESAPATLDATSSSHPSLAGADAAKIKGYFLPYIQDYFFHSGDNSDGAARMHHFIARCPGEMVFDSEDRHLSIKDKEGACGRQDGSCSCRGKPGSPSGRRLIAVFEQVHVTVFRYGVGFLSIDVRLAGSTGHLFNDVLSFNHAVLAGRGAPASGDNFLDCLAKKVSFLSQLDTKKHQSLVYAAVEVAPETFFESEKKEMLYKLCSAMDRDSPFSPSTFTDTVMEKMYMDVAENAIYGFSKGGGCLIYFPREGVQDGEMKIAGLLESFLTRDYILFLLSLHQRSTLMEFLHQLEIFGNFNDKRKIASLRSTFLDFTTQGWFSQVTTDELGMEKYRRWQNIFENKALYDEVFQQLEAVDDYNRVTTANKYERLSALFLPVVVLGSIFGMNFSELNNLSLQSAAGAVVLLFILVCWGYFAYSSKK